MSEFFDSEIVQEELQEITDLQQELYSNMLEFGTLPDEDKKEHIELLVDLLEKQRIMYTRLSLSDDPTAKELLENLKKSVQLLGFPPNTSVDTLFNTMRETIDNLKKQVDLM
tara:strand:- start:3595 stop:3930 length:336 start_codon:yes stop_codon:yes gene_type:complete